MDIMRFKVYLDAAPDEFTGENWTAHELVIMPADRMRAERASTTELAPSQRHDRKAHRETWLLLWLWCSAKRLGVTTLGFEPWADTVLDYDKVTADGELADDDAEEEAAEAVDPTQPVAPTG